QSPERKGETLRAATETSCRAAAGHSPLSGGGGCLGGNRPGGMARGEYGGISGGRGFHVVSAGPSMITSTESSMVSVLGLSSGGCSGVGAVIESLLLRIPGSASEQPTRRPR